MTREASAPTTMAFLLIPGFSMFTLSCAVEVFRVANERTATPRFAYRTVGVREREVASSDGIGLTADAVIADCPPVDMILVVSSLEGAEFFEPEVARWLRRNAHAGSAIAALGSAGILVAKTGLLDGYACVTHWRLHDDFRERFPEVRLTKGLYVIDRDRLSTGGGFSNYDLALAIVARTIGQGAASEIADAMLHPRIREPGESPRMAVPWRYGVTDERIVRAIEAMEQNIEQPASLEAISEAAGSSTRQLQRLFVSGLGRTPVAVYAEIRLRDGRAMLQQSTLSIAEIALKCGFADASHFTRRYRQMFGETPAETRRATRAVVRGDAPAWRDFSRN